MEIDDLCKQYCSRLKRSLLVTSLLLNIVYVIVLLGWHCSVENPLKDPRNVTIITVCALYVTIVTGFTILTCAEPVFNKAALPISLIIWALLLTFNLTYHAFLPLRTCSDGLVQNFLLILVTYISLPLPWIPTVLSGSLTGILQVVVPAVLADFRFQGFSYQIVANTVIVICANVLGIYHKYQHDVTNARTFLDARNCIESRIRLEHEQRQQEELLHSVLPVHLTVELRNKMLERLKIASIDTRVQQKRSAYGRFHDLYMKVHDNVTILYADIVNFTPLAAGYTAAELVMVLNQLFGKFDNLAQENDCLRIKILGDCYYCVSGLPVSRPSHASNCVRMGLAMILAIRAIRNATHLDVDMRIGAHTGSVVSGVLGLHKWQYDVWSDDVIIANHMESAGKPGVVHVSKETLLHLNEEFHATPAEGHLRSAILRENNIETFFISPVTQTSQTLELPALTLERKPSLHRTASRGSGAARMSQFVASWGMPKPFASLTDAPSNLTDVIQQSCVSMMESNLLPVSCAHPLRFSNHGDIHPAHLAFKKPILEAEFTSQEDLAFHYYVLAAGALFSFLTLLHILVLNSNMIFILSFVLGGSILAVMLVFSLLSFCHASADLKRSWWTPVTEIFHQIVSMAIARTGMAVFAIIIIAALSVITLIDVNEDTFHFSLATTNISTIQQSSYIPMAPYYILSMLMALVCSSLFFQLHFLLKCGLMALAAILDSVLLFVDTTSVFRNYSVFMLTHNSESFRFNGLDLRFEALLFIITLLIILHVLDRQTEYTLRVDFLWNNTFTLDKEEAEVMASLNKVLLQNILPTHVAEHFLTARHKNEDMYHESYSSASVMFASIANFWDFYRQTTVTKYGVECLKVLNEIISDFDQLLSKPKFSGIEKIKTIGSTYMAASGLRPGRHKKKEVNNGDLHVVALVDFALAMMTTLDGINKDTLNNFQLRIGINHGPVMAGVIGAQKPQYDIWGDTVNVASRMDSCGLQGRIQLPAATAAILIATGYDCVCRGAIDVKGKKEPMETYLLPRNTSADVSMC